MLFAAQFAFACCSNGDYEIHLSRGYFVGRPQPGDYALIANDRRTVVVRTVTQFGEHNGVIFGENAKGGSEPTLFFVNTRTGMVRRERLSIGLYRTVNSEDLLRVVIRSNVRADALVFPWMVLKNVATGEEY